MLDEAMAGLSDDDREALLLRFFRNHDLRAVGRALGQPHRAVAPVGDAHEAPLERVAFHHIYGIAVQAVANRPHNRE